MTNGGKKYKLVLEEGQSLSFKVPRDSRGKAKEACFDVSEGYEPLEEPATYTISSPLFDSSVSFKELRTLLGFVVNKGFACDIFKNGKILGTWNPVSGYVEF